MQTNTLAILGNLSHAIEKSQFASFTYTAKGSGEKAKHTVRLGADYVNAYKADIETLRAKRPALSGVALIACDEIIASLSQSLEKGLGNNDAYTCKDTYTNIGQGLSVHKETGALYVLGSIVNKHVITEGVRKVVKSSEKTLAKKELQRGLRSGKIRRFELGALHSARVNGETLDMR
jgi:hypothetical protein